MIDRQRLQSAIGEERLLYERRHARSAAAAQAASHLLCNVPMTWMAKWAGGFPLQMAKARGSTLTDLDGITYADFCLGDTGAMAGHSPPATLEAVRRRVLEDGGVTAMLPTEDAEAAAAELTKRFGLPTWSFTLSATDANRWALRIARHLTKRPKVLVFNWCYHGSVDETFASLEDDQVQARFGNVGPQVDPAVTTRVVEWNDAEGLERALAHGDVAAVLTEPALTNIGIVLPRGGFLAEMRELTTAAGTILIIDETHTISAGPGGATRLWDLQPDMLTLGKAIAGGIPTGVYGMSEEVAGRLLGARDADLIDAGGVGGTLAGNALSTAATRATLTEVLTEEAFSRMDSLIERYERGVNDVITALELPWSIARLGARAEFRFCSPAPVNGAESAAAEDPELDEFVHLFLANRDILLTPFHNMALACPDTTAEQISVLLDGFRSAAQTIVV